MEPLRFGDIVAATGGGLVRGAELMVAGVSIDTRTLQPGELYVAVRGKRFDGHQFVTAAIRAGAAGVVVDNDAALPATGCAVVVGNTTDALGRIAALHRQRVSCRVVAITGSNGKTTTKEMLAAILATKYRTLRPHGSFNNDIGVPLTVLRLERDTEAAVFEIEMNELGGTERLARICRPEVGVITNIGDTHLEFMSDRQGVAQEKAELLQVLPRTGTAVLNADDDIVMAIGDRYAPSGRLTFGLDREADVFATDIRDAGLAGMEFRLQGEHVVRLPVPGRHNVANCLAACAAAHALNMDFEAMLEAIAEFQPPPMRLRVLRLGSVTLVEDCYNANPQSVRAALQVLRESAPVECRIAFLGDMLELGAASAAQHETLGRELASVVNRLVLVGPMGKRTAAAALDAGLSASSVRWFETSGQARDALFDLVRLGDTILVKGSRAMAMELVSQEIAKHYGQETDRSGHVQ